MELSEEKQFALSHIHIRRKSTRMTLGILLITALALALNFVSVCSLNGVESSVADGISMLNSAEGTAPAEAAAALSEASQAIAGARMRLLVIGVLILVIAVSTTYLMLTTGVRVVAQEFWIRRMGEGDLDYKPDLSGNDEIAEAAASLEKLRQRSIRVVRLNLVEKLSQDLQAKNDELEGALEDLRRTQDQIVQQQKLAELGELTAGVAHEILNPLNLMQNFSEASGELLEELDETVAENTERLDDEARELIEEISRDLAGNIERTLSHGERADRIVRDMLRLGRGSVGFQTVDINGLLRESAMLAYRSARSAEPDFTLDIREELDPDTGEASVVPEDMARVFLNVVGNACYATAEKRGSLDESCRASYMPTIWLRTKRGEDSIEIRIRDNGGGIPSDVMEKIFNPFFTTKPTDKGSGLGLSLSNDIVREHGGTITPASEPGEYTEMVISIQISEAGG